MLALKLLVRSRALQEHEIVRGQAEDGAERLLRLKAVANLFSWRQPVPVI